MKTKLIRIPASVPLRVLREAVKLHEREKLLPIVQLTQSNYDSVEVGQTVIVNGQHYRVDGHNISSISLVHPEGKIVTFERKSLSESAEDRYEADAEKQQKRTKNRSSPSKEISS